MLSKTQHELGNKNLFYKLQLNFSSPNSNNNHGRQLIFKETNLYDFELWKKQFDKMVSTLPEQAINNFENNEVDSPDYLYYMKGFRLIITNLGGKAGCDTRLHKNIKLKDKYNPNIIYKLTSFEVSKAVRTAI